MSARRRSAFTLVEVLIVVVIMAVLAATIIPQFADSTTDAKVSTLKFNLHTLRSQIELYRTHHDGKLPSATLVELTKATDVSGAVGTGTNYPFGPYLRVLPDNPFSNKNTVTAVAVSPATVANVTANNAGGWLFNATTGEVWADHDKYVTQ
jgi:prepilin-type N-terminal cleavage/methylation domain-containing protein